MDIREFVASLVASLAWPLAAIGALFILRTPLVTLVSLLRRVRYGEVELGFQQELKELPASAAAALQETPKGKVPEPVLTDRIVDLAQRAPVAVIIEAWRALAKAAVAALHRRGLPVPLDSTQNPASVEQALSRGQVLSTQQVELLRRLRSIYGYTRDPAFVIAPGAALEYAANAKELSDVLSAK